MTGLTLAGPESMKAGDSAQLTVKLNGTITPETEGITVSPDAATFEVSAKNGETPVQLNSRTRVDNYGVLHLQKSGLAAGTVVTVVATAAYTNPSGETKSYTATHNVTIA